MRILVAVLVVASLVSLYFISWKLNKKQELPDDVKDSIKGCDSCSNLGCGIHPKQRGDENE